MTAFRPLIALAVIALTLVFATAYTSVTEAREIILPAPFSDLSAFQSTWCAPNAASSDLESPVVKICFGHVIFKAARTVRAVSVSGAAFSNEVYVESEWPAIDLLKLKFEIVGPIGVTLISEMGQLILQPNAAGEIVSLEGQTPRLGFFSATRGE